MAKTTVSVAATVAWPITVWVSFALMMAAVDYRVACWPNSAFFSLQLLIAPIILAGVSAWAGRAAPHHQLIRLSQAAPIVAIGVAAASAGLLFSLALAFGLTYHRYTGVLGFAAPLTFTFLSLLLAILPVAARRLKSPTYYSTWGAITVVLIVAVVLLRVLDTAARCH